MYQPDLKRQRIDTAGQAPEGYTAGRGRGAKGIMGIRPDNYSGHGKHLPPAADKQFGDAPVGYLPGRGRGATGFVGGVSRDEVDRDEDKTDLGDGQYDEFSGYGGSLFGGSAYDDDDREADQLYDEIDGRLAERRAKWVEQNLKDELRKQRAAKPTIKQHFADLARNLHKVSDEEWSNIPDCQEHLKIKDKKKGRFSALPDHLLAGNMGMSIGQGAGGATPLGNATPMLRGMGNATPTGLSTPMLAGAGGALSARGMRPTTGLATPMQGMRPMIGGASTPMSGGMTPMMGGGMTPMGGGMTPMHGGALTPLQIAQYRQGGGARTPLSGGAMTPLGGSSGSSSAAGNISQAGAQSTLLEVSAAKSHGLHLKLDGVESKVSNKSNTDALGYMTELASKNPYNADVQDLKKAGILMESVIKSNPTHASGWIAAARIEEMSGKLQAAKEKIIQGTKHCPHDYDVWKEAARLEKGDAAKAILARGVKENPKAVALWLAAAELETDKDRKSRVLRKALDFVPNSETLWKEAVQLEDEDTAKQLLLRAVQVVPLAETMWLALAKLCDLTEAQMVLNAARKKCPQSVPIWITAAKLQEKGLRNPKKGQKDIAPDMVIERAMNDLIKGEKAIDRDDWFSRAEDCEKTGYILTCKAIIKNTLMRGLEKEFARDPKLVKKHWIQDAQALEAKGSIGTARAVYEAAVVKMPTKKGLWRRYAELESKHGDRDRIDAVLAKATENCPTGEVLWLMRAKQKWMRGDLATARNILKEASQNLDFSEQIALAAAKLESESKNIQKARNILASARKQAESAKVWQQSVQLEREDGNYSQAKSLCDEAVKRHPKEAKLWMIAGQLILEDPHGKQRSPHELAEQASRKFEQGLQSCPKSVPLWLCCIEAEISQNRYAKARVFLEKARLRNPKNPLLWLKGVQVEEAEGNTKMAVHTLNKGLGDCGQAGLLWAKAIDMEPKQSQNSKAIDGLRVCDNDPYVQLAAAELFWKQNKPSKGRKWLQRAVGVDAKLGDIYGMALAFEFEYGSLVEQKNIIIKCMENEPNKGIKWNPVVKKVGNWRLSFAEKLREYVKTHHPEHWNPDKMEPEIKLLLDGETKETALEATLKREAEIREKLLENEAKRQTFDQPFIPSETYTGSRLGYVFKLGLRGQGYYEDIGIGGRKKKRA